MTELDPTVDVDTPEVDDPTTPDPSDLPDSFEYDEVVKMKTSLEKATSNYVLP